MRPPRSLVNGADHHRFIVDALRLGIIKQGQALTDKHLAKIEGRVKLTQGQGERHSVVSVLEMLSSGLQ